MDKKDSNKNNHNLEDTSKTLGQVFNVNSYDEKADRSSSLWKTIKRILIIAIIAFCFIYVLIALISGRGIILR